MPNTKSTAKTKITDSDEQAPVIEAEDIVVDNESLLALIKELKSEIAQLKKNANKPQAESDDDKFSPNKMTYIINMYNGFALSLKIDDHGGHRTLTKFGERMRIRISEAEAIVRLNRGFAEKGFFLLEDKELADYLGVAEANERSVGVNFINSLSEATPESIVAMFERANKYYRDLIIETFVDGYVKGEKIGFRDQRRLDALSKAAGEDISIRIKATQETRP